MNPDVIESVLATLGGTHLRQSAKWVNSSCPLAPWRHDNGIDVNPSFGVSKERGVAHCFTCNYKGSIMALAMECMQLSQIKPVPGCKPLVAIQQLQDGVDGLDLNLVSFEDSMAPIFRAFPEEWLGTFFKAELNNGAWQYLESRGFDLATVQHFQVHYDWAADRVVFPLRTFDGTLAGARGRSLNPDAKLKHYSYDWEGHRNETVLGNEWNLDTSLPLVVCEGHFDAATIHMAGWSNVACTMSASIPEARLNRLKMFGEVLTFLDPGTGGNVGRLTVETAFPRAASVI